MEAVGQASWGEGLSSLSRSMLHLHCVMHHLLLWLMDSLVMAHRLSCSAACRILVPRPGIKPVSPALAGGFLTTGPPGKSHIYHSDPCLSICFWGSSSWYQILLFLHDPISKSYRVFFSATCLKSLPQFHSHWPKQQIFLDSSGSIFVKVLPSMTSLQSIIHTQ